jgi:hypothetical protein
VFLFSVKTYGRKSETYENGSVPPTIREIQLLKKLRYKVTLACNESSPVNAKGSAIQKLTHKLLDLDTEGGAGRARVEDISGVVALATGVELSIAEQDAVVIAFSRMNDDRIILIEFIEYLRGAMSIRSKEWVYVVWDACNPTDREYISEEDVIQAMNRNIADDVKFAIMDSLHLYSCGRDQGIDIVDVIEYYRDVFAEVVDDEDFEYLLKTTWSI